MNRAKKPKPTIAVSIRMDEEMHHIYTQLAWQNRQSLNKTIMDVLDQHIRTTEAKEEKAKNQASIIKQSSIPVHNPISAQDDKLAGKEEITEVAQRINEFFDEIVIEIGEESFIHHRAKISKYKELTYDHANYLLMCSLYYILLSVPYEENKLIFETAIATGDWSKRAYKKMVGE